MIRNPGQFATAVRCALLALGLALFSALAHATPTDLNDIPMAVSNQVKANFLIVLDNSQSMDAFMGGALVSGDNKDTRGNLGRDVLRGVLDDYQNNFRWGLMSFATQDARPRRFNTYAYYMGDVTGMVFTDDCVNEHSASNGGRRCIANPQWSKGTLGRYVTYNLSSDDPEVLDAYYDTASFDAIWSFSMEGGGPADYELWFTHTTYSDNLWARSEFSNYWFTGRFSATDSGFLATYPAVSRKLFLPRGWGYLSEISGGGKLWEAVAQNSPEHYSNLISSLASEKFDRGSAEIKNAAIYTPLAGTLRSASDYFSGQSDWRSGAGYRSPITAWCQKNFVMLLTDGLPTGDKDGQLYSAADRSDSCSQWSSDGTSCSGTWTYGKAANDAFDAVQALRTLAYSGCTDCSDKKFDVQSYVVAMGDSAANARAVALMNEMAVRGTRKPPDEVSCVEGRTPAGGECVAGVPAFFATTAESLKSAVDEAVSNAAAQDGAAAAVAVANANITESTAAYQSSYESANWTGNLESYALDMATGAPKGDPLWSAQKLLDTLAASSRKIVSYNGETGGIQFQPSGAGTATALSAEQEISLSKSDAAGIVNYLRGDRSGEQAAGSQAQRYRRRIHLLGDIVNSEPVLLGAPSANYVETSDEGYAAFKLAHATRQALVFQGANDGLLHAFNANTGAEEWAYVPSLLLPTLAQLARVHAFSHRYYVDGTPSVGDVDFARTAGSTSTSHDWRSILVGGLGKGGHGYYALDVTSAIPTDEAAAAGKVLWEFPNAATAAKDVANLGYSFGRPIIAKTGDQGWVVLVTSGYNNTAGDGKGHLFVLNARTGAVISDLVTDSGSSDTPSGLAAFSAYVDSADVDNRVTQVYAGDLNGNVWRFDLTGEAATWNVKKLATLVDAAGNAQPVTTAPELASIFEVNATYRFVYVGTGQYLGDSDVTTTATQTMYGLVDDLSAAPAIAPLRGDTGKLQQQTLSAPKTDAQTGIVTRTATSNKLVLSGGGAKRGWYIDLPVSGERVSTDPQLALGSLVFTSNIPSGVLCVPGGSSYFNILDYRTGGALDTSVLAWSSKSLGAALASRPVLIRLPGGELRALIRLSSGKTVAEGVPAPLATPKVRRVSWRELPDTSK